MAANAVLVDTGPLVAVIDSDDAYHEVCREQFSKLNSPLYTCWPVITEAAYLLRAFPAQVRGMLSSCRGNPYEILTLDSDDLAGINRILAKYEDQNFQLADAALMYLAQRESIGTVFTMDHADFSVFRSDHGNALTLLPASS